MLELMKTTASAIDKLKVFSWRMHFETQGWSCAYSYIASYMNYIAGSHQH